LSSSATICRGVSVPAELCVVSGQEDRHCNQISSTTMLAFV
jgi:hypothetical protein